ncbi:DUF1385 domain-containing protein [bacterium]|nr:MAG: DUF1385 domain-containing protein [bacterium]
MAQFQLGGQALIEGVMMRGPSHVGAAVRRADGTIQTRVEPFDSILKKRPYLNIFLLRGIFALVEMMRLGTDYLQWSSGLALEDEEARQRQIKGEAAPDEAATATTTDGTPAKKKTSPLMGVLFVLTALLSFGFGAICFVVVPNFIAHFVFEPHIGNESRLSIIALTLIEGAVKLMVFVAYVWAIGRRKQIRRLFAYHGAEHKVVYAVENNRPLTPAGARSFDTPHPRCGTGFALLTVFVGIFCYSFLPWPDNHLLRVGLRLLMLPLVAGVSYEVLKATVNPRLGALANLVITPGMWLQRLTTAQPNDEQLEVACEAMRVLLEKETPPQPIEPEGATAMVNEEEAIV